MYGVYDYGVVTYTHARTHTRTHTRARATRVSLPREICDYLPQRHFFICNRIIAAMFEILILLTSPRVK